MVKKKKRIISTKLIFLLVIRSPEGENEIYGFETKAARDDTADELRDQFPLLDFGISEMPPNKKVNHKGGSNGQPKPKR